MLPLALAPGDDSHMQQPLAVAIIAGMFVQVALMLLLVPVFYATLMHSLGHVGAQAGFAASADIVTLSA